MSDRLTTQQLRWILDDAAFTDDPPCRPPTLADSKAMAEELIRLRRFAAWVMEAHTGTLDGWEIEEKAVELGLMEEVRCDGSCEDCCGAIPGEDNCYRPLLSPTAPPTAPPETP